MKIRYLILGLVISSVVRLEQSFSMAWDDESEITQAGESPHPFEYVDEQLAKKQNLLTHIKCLEGEEHKINDEKDLAQQIIYICQLARDLNKWCPEIINSPINMHKVESKQSLGTCTIVHLIIKYIRNREMLSEILSTLIKYGADTLSAKCYIYLVESNDLLEDVTPMELAILMNNVEAIKILYSWGAQYSVEYTERLNNIITGINLGASSEVQYPRQTSENLPQERLNSQKQAFIQKQNVVKPNLHLHQNKFKKQKLTQNECVIS